MSQIHKESISQERGRPRYPEVDKAILKATLQLLATKGYARMTMDDIAAEAGVGKPTIYLRYKGKIDVATAALAHINVQKAPPTTGDSKNDLIAQLRFYQDIMGELATCMQMIGTLLAEEHHTPELLALFRERVIRPRRQLIRDVLEQGVQLGHIRADLDLDMTVELLIGAYYAHYLVGETFPASWAEQVVATMWPTIAAPSHLTNEGFDKQYNR